MKSVVSLGITIIIANTRSSAWSRPVTKLINNYYIFVITKFYLIAFFIFSYGNIRIAAMQNARMNKVTNTITSITSIKIIT